MANEAVEVVRKPIEGLVAAIVSERQLALNIGSEHGVTRGMKFRVLGPPTEIPDPETGEKLGSVHRDKVRVQAETVSAKFSVCKTYRTFRRGSSAWSAGLADLLEPSHNVHETLRAEGSDYIPELSEEESFVKKGDKVKQILEADTMTIQDAESTLRGAILRGILTRDTVDEAVANWKQADTVLQEARSGEQGEEYAIDAALRQYNASTMKLTKLLNKVQHGEDDSE